MKHLSWIFIYIILLFNANSEEINIITTYPYIANIVENIGGDRVKVTALANSKWNPHTIVPKPSFIAKMRTADLLIINGAQLEIGWLPQLIRQANNPKIQFESVGFLDLSKFVSLIEIPKEVSRALGDVHPEGNPHYYLDYMNIFQIAEAIKNKLIELYPENQQYFLDNFNRFKNKLNEKIKIWETNLIKLKGTKVIEYHKIFDYFIKRCEMFLAGTLEPLPGIPPSSRHIKEVEKLIKEENIKFILQDVYNPDDAAKYLSKKYNIKLLILPHDVGATNDVYDIFSLFDSIIERLTND